MVFIMAKLLGGAEMVWGSISIIMALSMKVSNILIKGYWFNNMKYGHGFSRGPTGWFYEG
jgi:hypothetical protein